MSNTVAVLVRWTAYGIFVLGSIGSFVLGDRAAVLDGMNWNVALSGLVGTIGTGLLFLGFSELIFLAQGIYSLLDSQMRRELGRDSRSRDSVRRNSDAAADAGQGRQSSAGQKKICPGCGKALTGNASICKYCGKFVG